MYGMSQDRLYTAEDPQKLREQLVASLKAAIKRWQSAVKDPNERQSAAILLGYVEQGNWTAIAGSINPAVSKRYASLARANALANDLSRLDDLYGSPSEDYLQPYDHFAEAQIKKPRRTSRGVPQALLF